MKKLISLLILLMFAIPCFGAQGQQSEGANIGYTLTTGLFAAGGTIEWFKNDGSFDYQDVYSDGGLVTVLSQPIDLNNTGQPTDGVNPITIFASGTYTVRLKDSAGVTIWTRTDQLYAGAVDFAGVWIDVLSLYGTSDTDIDNLIAAYTGSASKFTFLWREGTYIMTSSKLFPENAEHYLQPGAIWDIAATTIVVSGDMDIRNNAEVQNDGTITFGDATITCRGVFNGSGTIVLTSPTKVFSPEKQIFGSSLSVSNNMTQSTVKEIWLDSTSDTITFNGVINVDEIQETTDGIGVTIDAVLLKDGSGTFSGAVGVAGTILLKDGSGTFSGAVDVAGTIAGSRIRTQYLQSTFVTGSAVTFTGAMASGVKMITMIVTLSAGASTHIPSLYYLTGQGTQQTVTLINGGGGLTITTTGDNIIVTNSTGANRTVAASILTLQ